MQVHAATKLLPSSHPTTAAFYSVLSSYYFSRVVSRFIYELTTLVEPDDDYTLMKYLVPNKETSSE
jgi:hypothetical protein